MTRLTVPKTFAELRRDVENALLEGQLRVDQARVRTYWETGWLIKQHVLLHEARAAYGAQVIPRLARELDTDERTLYHCVQFARYFPILSTCAELTWGHYRLLCQVEDAAQREALKRETIKRRWKCLDLEARIRPLNAAAIVDNPISRGSAPTSVASKPRLLTPKRGTPGLYLVVARADELVIDLGFKFYRRLHVAPGELDPGAAKLKAGDIVRVQGNQVTRSPDATKADLFTFAATLRRIVDGDTLVIGIDVAPDLFREEKLRLRGLDCPELIDAAGKSARRFVETLLVAATPLTVTTTKPDKYDRYLADVFVSTPTGEVFVNNALLENGHAHRKDAWEFRDWGVFE